MKALHAVIFLVATVGAHSQEQQCVQSEFSGEASQGQQRFVQELGQGITFSLQPMGRNAQEPRWVWFNMRVVDESKGIYVFSPSDGNWLLATPDWWSTFIGGPNSDVKRALEYRVRNLVFPLSEEDKQKLKEASSLIFNAKTAEAEPGAVAALKSMRLGQIRFEITDYRLAAGEPPMSVDWVKFTGVVTVPNDFRLSEKLIGAKLSLTYVDCPPISDEVIENMRNPRRHEYPLAAATTTAAER